MKRFAFLLLVATTAACSTAAPSNQANDAGKKNDAPAFSNFGSRASRAGTAHGTITMSGTVSGQAINLNGTMQMDFKKGISTAVMKVKIPGGGTLEVESVTANGFIYTKLPASMGGDASKPWVKQAAGKGSTAFTSDPSQMLSLLKTVASDLAVAGHADVRGVATTQYHGNIDIQKSLDAAAGAPTAEQRKALEGLRSQGVTSFPMDIWVADDGLPRKSKVEFAIQGGTFAMTMEFYDWGKPVKVGVPSASEVRA